MRPFADRGAAPARRWFPVSRVAGPPRAVYEAARAAFAHHVRPSGLAALIWDSDTDGPAAGRAGAGGRRVLWFGTDGLGVELVVERVPGRCPELRGRLMPQAAAECALLCPGGARLPVVAGADGTFRVGAVPPGLVRLRVARRGRLPLVTSWVNLERPPS